MRGMTWDHPRGIDPLLAASRTWQEQTGQDIQWDRRSLQDFETFPVEELARQELGMVKPNEIFVQIAR